ncbi:MAG: squalene--hopene cyclase [Sphingomonadales bacterium]
MNRVEIDIETALDDGKLLQAVEAAIEDAGRNLRVLQRDGGEWLFELEADATIPAEYIFLEHFLDEINPEVEDKLACYLRDIQADHGGWPLFHGGKFDISASVKAYYALKLVGDAPDAPHMKRAREAILAHGGAETSNVFTRYTLALFAQVPWRAVPVMPVELMLMPSWFPVELGKISYWSRTVITPLLILATLKPTARNPRRIDIPELFKTQPDQVREYQTNATGTVWGEMFLYLDKLLRRAEHRFPRKSRERALEKAVAFMTERLNGEDGLGAIFPAMTNSVMAMDALGYSPDHPDRSVARESVRKLLVLDGEKGYCQPCISPIWDTALVSHALLEAGEGRDSAAITRGFDWLLDRQILDLAGDWSWRKPDLRPGGWAFQDRNDHYPDVDDTAVVAMALHRADPDRYRDAIDRAAEWIEGMQSSNGGWGAFDIDNDKYYLNHIPFADHGALLDPPTADVTARCVSMLAQLGYASSHPVVAAGLTFLRNEQEGDGSWFGRWGTNYIYGTWSVLCAYNAAGVDMSAPDVRKAVTWLESRQRQDGGWGEDGATYWDESKEEYKESTPSQTAWAVLGLMAAGEVESEAVKRGIRYLLNAPRTGAKWDENWFTAVGFPRVFYLRYHGYSAYFPIWALARYRNLTVGNSKEVAYGM